MKLLGKYGDIKLGEVASLKITSIPSTKIYKAVRLEYSNGIKPLRSCYFEDHVFPSKIHN